MEAATRLNDDEAHDLAVRHLADVLGSTTLPPVAWDVDHHLQGHLDVAGHHMVLIATRTPDRCPLLLTDEDWDSLRRTHCHAADGSAVCLTSSDDEAFDADLRQPAIGFQ